MNNAKKGKVYVKAISMRVMRSTAATLFGIIGTAELIEDIKWNAILSTIAIAAVSNLLMCIMSLPETPAERIFENDMENQNGANNNIQKEE